MKKIIWLVLCFVGISVSAFATLPERYFPPEEIQLKIDSKGAETFETDVIVLVSVKAAVGTLKNLELFLSSSSDLKISTSYIKIGDLAEGSTRVIELAVKKVSDRETTDPSSWVQVRASYLPDHATIIEAVKTDTNKYSREDLRNELLSRLAKYQDEGETRNKTITYNFAEK